MDDILLLWSGTAQVFTDLLAVLNSMFPTIKFTTEFGGKAINFLDVNISIANGQHEFSIYRKDTYSNITINGSSFCPTSHKDAAFHSLIHRMISLPLTPKAFDAKLNYIKHLAQVNGRYNLSVDVLVKRKLTRIALNSTTALPRDHRTVRKHRWISSPFLGATSSALQKVLLQHGIKPAFYSVNTIRSLLSSLKDPIPRANKSEP